MIDPKPAHSGIDSLKSDFDLAFGELIWKSEMTSEALDRLLAEVRLAEFEREARAYRARGRTRVSQRMVRRSAR